MVDMRMGQQDGVDPAGIKGKRLVVQGLERLGPLEHPTVDKNAEAWAAQLRAGPGDASGGAVKDEIKRHS